MEFWESVRRQISTQNTTQEWVSRKAGIPFSTFRGWMTKNRLPRVDEAVKIALALDSTTEEFVLGKAGERHIIKRSVLLGLRPPERLERLCRDMQDLDVDGIDAVEKIVKTLISTRARAGPSSGTTPQANVS